MDISPHLCILRNLRNLLNTRQLHTSPSCAVLMPFTDMFRWIDCSMKYCKFDGKYDVNYILLAATPRHAA